MLQVRGLSTRFFTTRGEVHAVRDMSYQLARGESLAIVGESGSGKSVSALSLMGLVPSPGRVVAGEVILGGTNLLELSGREWRAVRGTQIAMVFQDPLTSLNPVLTIGYQLTEGLRRHLRKSKHEAREEAVRLLELVGIPGAEQRLGEHPHAFSGGQRQRIMIAMALACRPSVLIADEPTTALDVTIQDQIVRLVKELQAEFGMSIVWITHDLALVAGLVDRVIVMYAGSIVEEAPVRQLFSDPRHPYTKGLLESMPSIQRPGSERLTAIPGRPPDLRSSFLGCPFAERCSHALDRCRSEPQTLSPVAGAAGHASACLRRDEP
jgi:oligopeptide transport system ATP-binding protein